METKKKILCVGLVCYDIVNVVEHYPLEDTQMRTVEQRRSRGGNASNMCTVLANLNAACEFMGSLPMGQSPDVNYVEEDFQAHKIEHGNCPRHADFSLPNSCIIVNRQSGSRTILHTNDGLPELTKGDFSHINVEDYNWFHLEGRPNAIDIADIAKDLKTRAPNIPISLEMEKPTRANKDELFLVFPFIDLLFISKECAVSLGAMNMRDAVDLLQDLLPDNVSVVCPWGEKGAAARDPNGHIFEISGHPPPSGKVIDTVGAGDTFNAAVVSGIVMQDHFKEIGSKPFSQILTLDLKKAIKRGCKVAGTKVGMVGFSGISEMKFE